MVEKGTKKIYEAVDWRVSADSAQQQAVSHKKAVVMSRQGMPGQPLPFRMESDFGVTALLFFCFVLFSMALRNGKKYLGQHLKAFFQHKERASLFDGEMGNDMQFTLILGGVTCLLLGICLYDYYASASSLLFQMVPHVVLLSIYVFGVMLLYLLKRVLYGFVNWVFFDKSRSKAWIEAYFDMTVFTGFLLFPFVLLVVYFDLSTSMSRLFILTILLITKILLFYKCFRNFSVPIYGLSHLILYFCALEITPDFLLWQGVQLINSVLILNF